MTYFDFASRNITHNSKTSKLNNKEHNVDNYTMVVLDVFKLIFGVFFVVSSITGFVSMTRIINLYNVRKQRLIDFYVEMVKKKNEFDYVSSPAYKEVRLRKLYGAYKKGEKLVIFTQDVGLESSSDGNRHQNTREIWLKVLFRGINSIVQ